MLITVKSKNVVIIQCYTLEIAKEYSIPINT